MADPSDLHVVPQVKAEHNEKATIFFYDQYPGGIGLSKKIYEEMPSVLKEAKKMVKNCACEYGCPSCIGTESHSNNSKRDVIRILSLLEENNFSI